MSEPEPVTDPVRVPVGEWRPASRSTLKVTSALAIVGMCVACVSSTVQAWPLGERILALLFCAAAGILATFLVHPIRGEGAKLVVDREGIRRIEKHQQETLVRWSEPLGATVLASSDHPIVLLCLTTPSSTRYFWASVGAEVARAVAPTLLSRALAVADGDLRAEASKRVGMTDLDLIFRAIARHAPGALDRAYLSDSTGDAVILDRTDLCVGGRRIDLTTPLEWRAFIFQERGAVTSSLSQAMWVRQADAEFVLVSPVTEGAWIRYAKASAGEPPPRELRRAVDRLFMVPIARALTKAGRASRSPATPPRGWPMQKTPSA